MNVVVKDKEKIDDATLHCGWPVICQKWGN